MSVFSKFKQIFFPKLSDKYNREIDLANIKNINSISLFVVVMELCGLTVLLPRLFSHKADNKALFQVTFCVVLSAAIYFLSCKYKKSGNINHKFFYFLVIMLFAVFSMWGMFVSYSHYVNGEQIITFYIVITVLIAYIYIKPMLAVCLTISSFVIFYILLYKYDGASQITAFNYFAFALVCTVASMSKFHRLLNQLEGKEEIRLLNDSLDSLAHHDYLTGLLNRHALIEDIEAKYLHKDLCVIMCDCNNYKQINDKCGHLIGDEAILAISDILRRSFANSQIYRYGGDEFLIICKTTDEAGVINMLCDVNSQIEKFDVREHKDCVSCAFGYKLGLPETFEDFEGLLREADAQMYTQKHQDQIGKIGESR